MDTKAILEEIQKINLEILTINEHCSSLDSSDKLSQLKAKRNELYQQVANIRHNTNMQRLQK